jgi:NADPH:quinone reductase
MSPSNQALCVEHLSDDLSGVALQEVPLAPLGPQEVRVQVRAAGLNFPDLLMTRGAYQLKPPLPFVCGMEGAGVVLEAGAQVHGWHAGDEVCFSHRGTLAQQVVLPVQALQAIPARLSMQEAACAQVTALTAWVALARRAKLQRGEWLLVNGARGGVGWACLQLGQHLGARLIATATDPARLGFWRDQGVPVLKADASLPEAVKALTNGQGVDVVADPVGGELFDHSLRCLAWEGRLLVLGFAAGSIPRLSVNRALIKGLAVLGVRAGEAGRRNPQAGAENRAAVQRLLAQGVMRPSIGLAVPLAQGKEALRAMAAGSVVGKIVVTMD